MDNISTTRLMLPYLVALYTLIYLITVLNLIGLLVLKSFYITILYIFFLHIL